MCPDLAGHVAVVGTARLQDVATALVLELQHLPLPELLPAVVVHDPGTGEPAVEHCLLVVGEHPPILADQGSVTGRHSPPPTGHSAGPVRRATQRPCSTPWPRTTSRRQHALAAELGAGGASLDDPAEAEPRSVGTNARESGSPGRASWARFGTRQPRSVTTEQVARSASSPQRAGPLRGRHPGGVGQRGTGAVDPVVAPAAGSGVEGQAGMGTAPCLEGAAEPDAAVGAGQEGLGRGGTPRHLATGTHELGTGRRPEHAADALVAQRPEPTADHVAVVERDHAGRAGQERAGEPRRSRRAGPQQGGGRVRHVAGGVVRLDGVGVGLAGRGLAVHVGGRRRRREGDAVAEHRVAGRAEVVGGRLPGDVDATVDRGGGERRRRVGRRVVDRDHVGEVDELVRPAGAAGRRR